MIVSPPRLAEDSRESEYSSLVGDEWIAERGLAARLRQPYHKGIGDSKHNKGVSSDGSSNGTNFSKSRHIRSDDVTQQTRQKTSVVTAAATTPITVGVDTLEVMTSTEFKITCQMTQL